MESWLTGPGSVFVCLLSPTAVATLSGVGRTPPWTSHWETMVFSVKEVCLQPENMPQKRCNAIVVGVCWLLDLLLGADQVTLSYPLQQLSEGPLAMSSHRFLRKTQET